MKKSLFLFTIILSGFIMAQEKQLAWDLYYSYENFKEKTLTNRRFKHSDIIPLIEQAKNNKNFKVDKVGTSAEERDIHLISVGNGNKKVFLWSQMHGDEPTATAAIFDILNFFYAENEFVEFKNFLLSNLTLSFLPMLNPDGAELFQRRNIFEIDLNRDVQRQQAPEAKILKNVFDTLNADFGFNLHDQSREYSAGNTINPASISFLAPAPDWEKTVTPIRENAMKLIGTMLQALNEFIPAHIGKYSDDYESRAFGDNFTKWGTSVVLLETGGWRNDREKQFLRKINFIALLTAFASIATESYKEQTIEAYESLPKNRELMMDVIFRNLKIKKNEHEFLVDIGINFEEKNLNDAKDYYLKAEIEDIGDLSVYAGYKEFDLNGYFIEAGKTKTDEITSIEELKTLNVAGLFKAGYTNVLLITEKYQHEFSEYKFNIAIKDASKIYHEIKVEGNANFIIKRENEIRYAVVNGFLYDLQNIQNTNGSGIVYK
ncbi:MAG: peptidase M14 [Ignavibacteria bacterium]|nr:peptidase M14 [Ignavibacteria bacterium]